MKNNRHLLTFAQNFKQQLLLEQNKILKAEMGKKSRTSASSNLHLIDGKENIKNIVMFKAKRKKQLCNCSSSVKKPKKFGSMEKENQEAKSSELKASKSVAKEKLKPKSSNEVDLKKEVILNQHLMNASKALEKTKTRSMKSCDSAQNAKYELKQDFSEIKNNQGAFQDPPHITKEAVVMLERYKDVQKESISSISYDNSNVIHEDSSKTEKFLNTSKNSLPECDYCSSLLITEAVVILERCDDIREKGSKSYENSTEMLEDSGKAKKVPNKSGKGTKRKQEDKGKNEDEGSSKSKKSKKQKDSGKSKNSKKEKIPDISGIDFNSDSKCPSGNLWNLKISSWNINGIRAWLEKNGISYLHHEQPDILCVQETKCSNDKIPDEAKNIEGYHTYWLSADKGGYSGVGLITKEEPIKVEYGIGISEHDEEGRVITAEYEKFYVVCAYVPNAGRGLVRLDYRMKWDKDFRQYLKKLDDEKPIILCGDLNVAHEEIDLANPKTNKRNAGFTIEEREGFTTLLKEDLIDTFRRLYPNVKGAYTFWTYMMNARAKDVGWRLDYFVISEKLTENLCDSVIRKDVLGSDHCPITLFLSF